MLTSLVGRIRASLVCVIVAFALFLDYLLYGIAVPLAPYAPSHPRPEQLGILYGLYAVGVLVITPLFGYFGDRLGARRTLLCGVTFGMLSSASFAIGSSVSILAAAKVCQGIAAAALWTAGLGLITEYYREKRVEMIGYAFTGSTAGSVLGPLLGGLLHRGFGYSVPFIGAGLLFGVAGGLMFLLPKDNKGSGAPVRWRALLLNPSVVEQAGFVALAAFAWGIIEPLVPYHLEGMGVDSGIVALLFTVSSIAFGLSAPWVGRLTELLSTETVVFIGILAMAAMLPSLSMLKHITAIALLLCLINVSYAFILNPAAGELGNAVDRAGMSCYTAVYAVYNIAYSVGTIGTAALATSTAGFLDFGGMLMSVSVVLGLCGLIMGLTQFSQRIAPGKLVG